MTATTLDPSLTTVLFDDPGWVKVVQLPEGLIVIARSSLYRDQDDETIEARSRYAEGMALVDYWTEHHGDYWVGPSVIIEVYGEEKV